MARTSRNGAPAPTLDDIDNIDIDDMFADDGDELFDGLDIDLDQMGDITNNMESVPAADMEANAVPESPPEAPKEEEELPKRRKTKRKTKSPAIFDDEEYEQPEPRSKKRRSTKTGAAATTTTTKKKTSKKEKDDAKAVQEKTKATTTKIKGDKTKADGKTKGGDKSKNKLRGSITMPPPLTRPQSSGPPPGIVAAAGQFGGRQKRGMGLPLARGTSDKVKGKSKTSSTKASSLLDGTATRGPSTAADKTKTKKTGSAPPSVANTPEVLSNKTAGFSPPVPHTTFCGIKSSNTIFYPFLPALPSEPSIKNRKQFPHVDKIFSAFMSFAGTGTSKAPNGVLPAAETEHIFRLMLDTMKDVNPTSSTTPAADVTAEKKTSIANAVGAGRYSVAGLDQNDLAEDLFNVCYLLKRQYDFLQQNMTNMERWCKDNFSKADFAATYGPPESAKVKKEAGAKPDSILAKFKKPIIKVKVKLNGFKEHPQKALLADLSAAGVGLSSHGTGITGEAKQKKTKKRKSSVAESPALQTPAAAVKEKEVMVKTYAQLRPTKRRRLISDLVSQTARDLEIANALSVESSRQVMERRHAELKKMIDEDEVVVIHTAAMWQFMEKVGYFADFTEEKMKEILRGVWGPELRDAAANEVSRAAPSKLGSYDMESEGMPQPPAESRKSAFNCLQSLLVEDFSNNDPLEGSDDSDGDDASDEDDDDEEEEVDTPMRMLTNNLHAGGTDIMVDLSNLTVDERTILQLKSSGLFEDDYLPPASTSAAESPSTAETPESISSRGEKGSGIDLVTSDDTCEVLEEIIEDMSSELLKLNKVNNARASFLESAARSQLQKMGQTKSRLEEEASLHLKCQQLLKRTKDTKVKATEAKPPGIKEEYALPW